LDCVP